MSCPVRYHGFVRHLFSAPLALFSLLALPVILVPNSQAQINGIPSSVTSPGFGGRAVNGTPPSVSSLGPRGFAPRNGVTFTTHPPVLNRPIDDGRRHHHHRDFIAPLYYPYAYAVPVPYEAESGQSEAEAEDDADYQGGPTIFDRRGAGAESYVPPVRDILPRRSVEAPDNDPPVPEQPQEPTLLVFRDGHKVEVGNYAIVGATLFDLTPGHPRKVALADLDLDATQKQNDDHGVVFRVPLPDQAN